MVSLFDGQDGVLALSERLAKGVNDSRKVEISNNEKKQSAGNKNVVIIFFNICKSTWASLSNYIEASEASHGCKRDIGVAYCQH